MSVAPPAGARVEIKKAKDKGFSYYGLRNSCEFVAESIAQYYLANNPGKIAKQVVKILKGE